MKLSKNATRTAPPARVFKNSTNNLNKMNNFRLKLLMLPLRQIPFTRYENKNKSLSLHTPTRNSPTPSDPFSPPRLLA